MSDQESGRDFLVRLLDSIRDDVEGVRRDINEIRRDGAEADRYARAAFSRVEACEDTIETMRAAVMQLDDESKLSTNAIIEIKTVAKTVGKGAGIVWGVLAGALGGFLAAWLAHLIIPTL